MGRFIAALVLFGLVGVNIAVGISGWTWIFVMMFLAAGIYLLFSALKKPSAPPQKH